MNEQDAIERVAKAIHEVHPENQTKPWDWVTMEATMHATATRREATAAIAAYNAYLRERAQEPDVVEAAAKAHINNELDHAMAATPTFQELGEVLWMRELGNTQYALTAALDAMLGKENHNDRG